MSGRASSQTMHLISETIHCAHVVTVVILHVSAHGPGGPLSARPACGTDYGLDIVALQRRRALLTESLKRFYLPSLRGPTLASARTFIST